MEKRSPAANLSFHFAPTFMISPAKFMTDDDRRLRNIFGHTLVCRTLRRSFVSRHANTEIMWAEISSSRISGSSNSSSPETLTPYNLTAFVFIYENPFLKKICLLWNDPLQLRLRTQNRQIMLLNIKIYIFYLNTLCYTKNNRSVLLSVKFILWFQYPRAEDAVCFLMLTKWYLSNSGKLLYTVCIEKKPVFAAPDPE